MPLSSTEDPSVDGNDAFGRNHHNGTANYNNSTTFDDDKDTLSENDEHQRLLLKKQPTFISSANPELTSNLIDDSHGLLMSPSHNASITFSENKWNAIRTETKRVARLSMPCMAASVLQYANKMVVILMVGHLGKRELASSSLAIMYANVTGFSLLAGLSSALETLVSQAVTGSTNIQQAGILLQRAILLLLVCILPFVLILWLFAEPILVALHQEPILASMASQYLLYMIPGLPASIIFSNIVKFLQAQEYMDANSAVLIAVFPINIILQYVFVFKTDLGYIGAPLASSICDFLSMALIICYTIFINGHQAWGGLDLRKACDLRGCVQFFQYGIPGVLMLCSEWWLFELAALAAGLFGEDKLGAQSIVLTTSCLTYTVYLGISIANANRVGNFLGGMAPSRAKLSANVSIGLAGFCACFFSIILISCRHVWGYIFTNDVQVVAAAASILPLAGVYQIFDGINATIGGILRGCGRQKIGAIVNFSTYYLVALPLGGVAAFVWKMELFRIWLGLTTALMLQSICYMVVIYRTDWEQQCLKARKRIRALDDADLDAGSNGGGLLRDRDDVEGGKIGGIDERNEEDEEIIIEEDDGEFQSEFFNGKKKGWYGSAVLIEKDGEEE